MPKGYSCKQSAQNIEQKVILQCKYFYFSNRVRIIFLFFKESKNKISLIFKESKNKISLIFLISAQNSSNTCITIIIQFLFMIATQSALDPHGKDQHHNSAGEYIKSAVYGGLDGLVTTLIIVISGIGNSSSPGTILALGIASMIGDGLGMAVADYLGTKSDDEYMCQEELRERKEIQQDLQAEKAQMIHLYEEMGLKKPVATEIVQILSKNKEGFLKIMMIEELQLIAGEENPITNSLVTFFAFALFGLTSLVPTIVAKAQGSSTIDNGVAFATIATAVFFLSTLGVGKALVGGMKWYLSVGETVLIGALSAGAAYGIGKAF